MIMPVRRDVRFALPSDRICDWHKDGPFVTHFLNAMSIMFPAGERFFMDSVREYRDRIVDPVLKQQVAGFIGQEAMHTREHVEYNDLIEAMGLPADKLDKRLWKILAFMRKTLGPRLALGGTLALEHYTALFASAVLRDPKTWIGGIDAYAQVWMWHAYEETEHKSVSFDVWNTVFSPNPLNYGVRCFSMLVATAIFWPMLFMYHVELLRAHRRQVGKIGILNTLRGIRYIWGPKGVIPSVFLDYLDYFRPGFHPWDHDNSEDLVDFEALIAKITRLNQQHVEYAAPRRVPLHAKAEALV